MRWRMDWRSEPIDWMPTMTNAEIVSVLATVLPRAELIYAEDINSGVHSTVYRVQVRHSDEMQSLIVKQQSRESVQREATALQALQSSGLPVPQMIGTHHDETGSYLVQSQLAGESIFAPDDITTHVQQWAQILAWIHRTPIDISSLPDVADECHRRINETSATLDATMSEAQIRQMLASWDVVPRNAPALLHGDFWCGNLLWQGDALTGIIDWEDAALGDPLADVANSRREVLWFYGREAMQAFTDAYRQQMPHLDYGHLPYWDACMALRPIGQIETWCLDAAKTERFKRRQRWFVQQAATQLEMQAQKG